VVKPSCSKRIKTLPSQQNRLAPGKYFTERKIFGCTPQETTIQMQFTTDNNTSTKTRWTNPLPEYTWSLPLGKYSTGGFGSKRKHGIHAGIDLFCDHNQPLSAVEEGIVVAIRNFSKHKKNKTPWLNRTRVILIEGETGVVAYCNVVERPGLEPGDLVDAGEIIGKVIRINKRKRKQDRCMLHIELYTQETTRRAAWSYNFPKPTQLLDPTDYLVNIITKTQVSYRRNTSGNSRPIAVNTSRSFRRLE